MSSPQKLSETPHQDGHQSMFRILQPLFALLASSDDQQLRQTIQYLQAENRILREKLPKQITVTARERARLVRLGSVLGGAIKSVITIVSSQTFAAGSPGKTTAPE